MFSFGKTKSHFTAAFLEKQPRTALFQTRLRNVEEPTQLTWTVCLFCLATQKGFSADAVLSVSTIPTLWKNIFPCVLASSSSLIMNYHMKILYRKKAVLSISFPKKERKRRYNRTKYNKQRYNKSRYNILHEMFIRNLLIVQVFIPFVFIPPKTDKVDSIHTKFKHEKAILLKTRV